MLSEMTERAKIGFLRRVFRQPRVAQHALGDGVGHRLCPLYETAEGVEVSVLRASDELVDEVHVTPWRSLRRHTRRRSVTQR